MHAGHYLSDDGQRAEAETMPRGKSEKTQDRSFTMRVDQEWEDAVDDLRILERPVLSRAAYVRKMILDARAALPESALPRLAPTKKRRGR
jgi:hypothetical protein